MKTFILLSLLVSNIASAATFNRFWVGYKKTDVSAANFMNGLNQKFFEQTIQVGRNKGLISYQPYVTKMNSDLPDELALVMYESEEKYKAIRNTPAGQAYSDSHWDFFQKETSKSTVTVPFTGTLAVGGAYQLNANFKNWMSGTTYVAIYSVPRGGLEALTKAFAELKHDRNLNDSMILVTDKAVYEYRSYKSKTKFKALPLKVLEQVQLPVYAIEKFPKVDFGAGINFKF